MIELTVALPIYNSKDIAWIAFEGLCNQKGIDFKWELLVMEEKHNAFGVDNVRKYVERLKAVGCAGFKYFGLDYQVNLPAKWKSLAEKRSETSIGYLLQAADDCPEPYRLATSYKYLKEGYDWVQNRYGYFFNISTGQCMEYDAKSVNYPTGLNMACASHLLHGLKETTINHAVDRWFFQSVNPQKVKWIENDVKGGCYTDGLNNISLTRKRYYNNPVAPFKKTSLTIEEVIPTNILTKLKTLKNDPLIAVR